MSGVVKVSRSQLREIAAPSRPSSQPNVMKDLTPDKSSVPSAGTRRPSSSGGVSVTSARKERAQRIASATLSQAGATTQRIRPTSASSTKRSSRSRVSSAAKTRGTKSDSVGERSRSARSTRGDSGKYSFRAPKGRPSSAQSNASNRSDFFLTRVPGDSTTNFTTPSSPSSVNPARPKSTTQAAGPLSPPRSIVDSLVDLPSEEVTPQMLDDLPDPVSDVEGDFIVNYDDDDSDGSWDEEALAARVPSESVKSLITDLDLRLADKERLQSARRQELDGYVEELRTHRDNDGDNLVEFPDDFNEIVGLMDKEQLMGQWADFIFKTPFMVGGQNAEGSVHGDDDSTIAESEAAVKEHMQMRDGYKRMRKLEIKLAAKERNAREAREQAEKLQELAAHLDEKYPHKSRIERKAGKNKDKTNRPGSSRSIAGSIAPSSGRSWASSRASSRQRAALNRTLSRASAAEEARDFISRNIEMGGNARFFTLQEEDSARVDQLLEQDDDDFLYVPDEVSTVIEAGNGRPSESGNGSRPPKGSVDRSVAGSSRSKASKKSDRGQRASSPPLTHRSISRPGTGYVPASTELDRLSAIDKALQAHIPETEWESRSLLTGDHEYAASLFAESLRSGAAGKMSQDKYLREARLKREAMNRLSDIDYRLQDMQVTPRNLTQDDIQRLIMEAHRERADNAPEHPLDIHVVDQAATAAALARQEARQQKAATHDASTTNVSTNDPQFPAAPQPAPRPPRPTSQQRGRKGASTNPSSTHDKSNSRPVSARHSLYEWTPPPAGDGTEPS